MEVNYERLCSFLAFCILATVVSISCNKSSGPITPTDDGTENREAQLFAMALPIFGTNPPDPDEPPHYHNIDLAQIRYGWAWYASGPTYWDVGCAAVTLERQDNTPANPFKPRFRWLDSSVPDEGWGPAFVTEREILNPENEADYRNPKCAAIFDFDQNFIELAVCYQVRNSGAPNNADWDVGMTRLLYYDVDPQHQYLSQFPNLGPADRIDYVFSDPGGFQWNEMNPDIAYDCINGDIYLVYENEEAPQLPIDPTRVRLKYRRFDRDDNLHRLGNWGAEWYAQTYSGGLIHNGFTPSIDVGLLDLSLVNVPQDNVNYVVIAYTSQFLSGHLGYHVAVTAWNASSVDSDKPTSIQLRNPEFRNQNAGVPCVSITPASNNVNFAAIAFQQIVDTDAYGPVNRIYEVDMTSLANPLLFTWEYLDLQDGFVDLDDGLYPAIALHEEIQAGDNIVTNASITFLAQFAQSALLDPYVARVGIVHPNPAQPPPWPHVVGYNDYIPTGTDITGNYNIDHIPILDPGASTTVVFGPNATYWAAWCDRIEMEDPPETVWASFGNTTPN